MGMARSLDDRLKPVVRSSEPKAECTKEPSREVLVPMAQELRSASDKVAIIGSIVESLLARLELP